MGNESSRKEKFEFPLLARFKSLEGFGQIVANDLLRVGHLDLPADGGVLTDTPGEENVIGPIFPGRECSRRKRMIAEGNMMDDGLGERFTTADLFMPPAPSHEHDPLEHHGVLGQGGDQERRMIEEPFGAGEKPGPITLEDCFHGSCVSGQQSVFLGHHEDRGLGTAERDGLRVRREMKMIAWSREVGLDDRGGCGKVMFDAGHLSGWGSPFLHAGPHQVACPPVLPRGGRRIDRRRLGHGAMIG